MPEQKQMRFSDEELGLLKSVFGGNETILKLLRKIFLPEYDYSAPIGQVVDLWMTVPPNEITPEYAYVNWKARNQIIAHIEQQLAQIQYLSSIEKESPDQKALREKKDSTK